jgi:hypothetical protein
MTLPQAYEPQYGYRYQILYRVSPNHSWESIDYAIDKSDRDHLMREYHMAPQGGEYRSIELPRKYWSERE